MLWVSTSDNMIRKVVVMRPSSDNSSLTFTGLGANAGLGTTPIFAGQHSREQII